MKNYLNYIKLLVFSQLVVFSASAQMTSETLAVELASIGIDEFEYGYGVEGEAYAYVLPYIPGDVVTISEPHVIRIEFTTPTGVNFYPALSAGYTLPSGYEYVYYDDNYAYITNSGPVTIDEDGVLFSVPVLAVSGVSDQEFAVYLSIDDDKVFEYEFDSGAEVAKSLEMFIPDVTDPLNVEFVSLDVQSSADCALDVEWTVSSSELTGLTYIVTRSTNGSAFEHLARVDGRDGEMTMSFRDQHPRQGTNMYRIVQVDKDGKQLYSKVGKADAACTLAQNISVFPNPAESYININGLQAGQLIKIFDVSGREVYTAEVEKESAYIELYNQPSGAYLISVFENNIEVFNGKLIKN